jgi:hypothetical protein
MQGKPSFTIEKDKVGLGHCVIAQWPKGRREVITGFGAQSDAQKWIDQGSDRWLAELDSADPIWQLQAKWSGGPTLKHWRWTQDPDVLLLIIGVLIIVNWVAWQVLHLA